MYNNTFDPSQQDIETSVEMEMETETEQRQTEQTEQTGQRQTERQTQRPSENRPSLLTPAQLFRESLRTPASTTSSSIPQSTESTDSTMNNFQQAADRYTDWVNSLNNRTTMPNIQPLASLDSSGVASHIQDLAHIIQTTLQIPVDNFHIEVVGDRDERTSDTSVTMLTSGSSLMLVPPESVNSENETCAICRNTYVETDIIRKLNSCEHFFHARCVEEWFRNHSNCPVCRTHL